MLFANGEVYDGEWANGVQHGLGVFYYKDGSMAKGRWEHGAPVETLGDILAQYDGLPSPVAPLPSPSPDSARSGGSGVAGSRVIDRRHSTADGASSADSTGDETEDTSNNDDL